MDTKNEVWIGLAEVEQMPGTGVLLDRNLAFVNVLSLAHDEHHFRSAVELGLEQLGFKLLELEDAEPFLVRAAAFQVGAALLGLADLVQRSGQIQLGEFFTWTSSDETS